jgi:hypothetical protein
MVTDRVLFDGAESPGARMASRAVRTNGSAKVVAVELSAARMGVPSSRTSEHQEPQEVNSDASLFVGIAAEHDSAEHVRHVCGDRAGFVRCFV